VLTLERQGGADAVDLFEGSGALSLAGNGDVVIGGTAVGTWSTATAGRLQITFNADATPALVDQVAQSIAYRYAGDAPPASVTIGWTIGDGNTGIADQGAAGVPLTDIGSVTVNLTAVNDAPILDPTPSPVLDAILEDAGGPVNGVASGTLVSDLVGGITDPDLTPERGIAITGADASQGTWWFSTDGGANWSALGTPGENAARLLAADGNTRIHFQPNADWNGELASALTIRAWDLSAGSNGGTADATGAGGTSPFSAAADTVSLTVTPVNDAPTLAGLPAATTFTEGGTPALISPSAALGDIDSPDFGGGSITVTITQNGEGTDILAVRHEGTGAGQIGFDGTDVTYGGTVIGTVSGGRNGQPLVIGLDADATLEAVRALTRNLTFESSSSYPGNLDRTVRIDVIDGDGRTNGGADDAHADTVVRVQRVNDRPALSGLGGSVIYGEGLPAIVLAPGAGLSDAELGTRDNWSGAVLTLAREVGGVPAPDAQDRFGATGTLQFTDGGNVTVAGVTVGTWSAPAAGQIRIVFDADATTALAGQVLSQITYANDAQSLPGSVSIGWSLSDGNTGDADQGTGGALAGTGSVTVVFGAVNDPPANTAPAAVTTNEDTPFTFTGADRIRISDPDAQNAPVQVRLIATGGTITLSGTSGLTFTTGDGTADPAITVTGTIADINAALEGLVFTPGQHLGEPASLRIVTDDLGNTGSGGALQDDDTIAITVTPVPDAPMLAVETAVVTEDRSVPLSISPALVDTDGSETLSIEISGIPAGATFANTAGDTLVPSGGTLTLTPAQLAGLRITPPPHSDVDFALTVTATATETANGTSAATVRTLPVQVEAEADAPLLTVGTATGGEDSRIPLSITTGLVDADGSESLSIVISNIPAGSILTNAAGDTLTPVNGTLTLTPAQLAGLGILPPADRDTGFTLTVTAISTEAANGDEARTVRALPVDITPAADAPRAMDGLPDRVTIEEDTISYALPAGLFQEVDTGDTVTISARLAGGGALPSWLRFDPAKGTFTGSPLRGDAGTYLIEVIATGTDGLAVAVPYTILVNPAPQVVMPDPPRPADPVPPPAGQPGGNPGDPFPPLITGPGNGDGYGSGPVLSDLPRMRDPNALLSQGGLDFGSFNSRLDLLLVGSPGNRVVLPEINTTFQVPRTIFRHSNPSERLAFEARRPDGEPLPSWLRFDPETLTFTGTPPASAQGGLDVVILAKDTRGNQASAPFRITVTRDIRDGVIQGQAVPQPAASGEAPAPQDQDPQGGQESGQEGEPPQPSPSPEASTPDRRASAEPGSSEGAPALSAQIRLVGRAGLYAEGRALLGSLADAPDPEPQREARRASA
jgi:Putative Ig domain